MQAFLIEFILCPIIALLIFYWIWGRHGGDGDHRR